MIYYFIIFIFSMFTFTNLFKFGQSNENKETGIHNTNRQLINQQEMSLYKFSPTDLYKVADDVTDLRDRPGGLMPGIIKSIGTGQDRYGIKKYERDVKGLTQDMVAGLYELSEGKQEILPHEIKLFRKSKDESQESYLDHFKKTLLSWISQESIIYGRDFQGIRLSGIIKIIQEKIEDIECHDEKDWMYLIVEVCNGKIKVSSPNELKIEQEQEFQESLNNRGMDDLIVGSMSLTNLFVRFINNYLDNHQQVISTFHLESNDNYTINYSIWHHTYPIYNEDMTLFILDKIHYLINEQIMSEDMEEILFHYNEMKKNVDILMGRIRHNLMLPTIKTPLFIKSS